MRFALSRDKKIYLCWTEQRIVRNEHGDTEREVSDDREVEISKEDAVKLMVQLEWVIGKAV